MPKEKMSYQKKKFSIAKMILADYNKVAATFHRVTGLIEIDITKPLAKMEEIEKKDGYKVSMTAWVVKCVSQAVKENMHLNTYRKGRKLIIFDDIDISIIIEITTRSGKKVPYNYVIRNADQKSVKSITDEIRAYQDKKMDDEEQLRRGRTTYSPLYALVPKFIRKMVIKGMLSNPFRLKKLIGTIGITSLGMFLKGQGGYAIPFSDKTLNIAIGSIKEQAIIRDGQAVVQKVLCTTFLFDHDIVDGAPATRFISGLSKMMSENTFLDDLEKV